MRLAGTQWRSALRSEGRSGVFCAHPHPRGPRRPTQRRSRPAPPLAPARSSLGRDEARRLRSLWSVVAGWEGGAARARMRARGRARGLALSTLGINTGMRRRAVPSGTRSQKIQPGTDPCCLVATLGGPQAPTLSPDACGWLVRNGIPLGLWFLLFVK